MILCSTVGDGIQNERERACVTEHEWVCSSTGEIGGTFLNCWLKQVSCYRWDTKVGWLVEGLNTATKEFSCLALLYILAADQVQQLKQKEATIHEYLANTWGKKRKKKSRILHHLQGTPLQDHVKTWEARQEPVGLQGQKASSCSLVRLADCHEVLETISSDSAFFSPLKNEILLPQYFVSSFNLCDTRKKKKMYTMITGDSNDSKVSGSLGWGGFFFN